MSSRIHRLEVRNFKAFREFTVAPEGRHLLIYGSNGSGKSSLYWTLYTFLQSAHKPTPGVAKYFDPADPQNLLNIHEQAEAAPRPGEIAVTLRELATRNDTTYHISLTDHGTRQQPAILTGNLASDFITYRFFFGFSHFRNSEKFNLWPLFEKEILPFCLSTGGGQTPLQMWEAIKSENPNPGGSRGPGGSYAYADFHRRTASFAAVLTGVLDNISNAAQAFYNKHFSKDDLPKKITLKLGLTTPPSSTGDNLATFDFQKPVIGFAIQVDGKTIMRPQSFLNEAKMTQLALSVRFAASLVNLHRSDLKLLVLDDLLVSLDMSNRMRVVEILLNDADFNNYQKVILTHDYGLFREFARTVGGAHPDWLVVSLQGTPAAGISCQVEKTELQKAEEYLHGHRLDEAAICLRKATEDTARRYLKPEVVPTKDFVTLSQNLRAARKKLLEKLPTQLYDKVLIDTSEAHRGHLLPVTDTDVDTVPGLNQTERDALKEQRKKLRTLFTDGHWKAIENAKLIDEVLKTTERVLNPGAHGGSNPLYKAEVQHALNLVARLELCLA